MTHATHRKIIDPGELAPILREQRAGGRTIVQCHGCFDIVHPGHIRYLQFARQLGDRLVVSLTGDATIAKGAGRPHIPQELRAENLAALEIVDWVVIDPHPTASELLDLIRPDVYVKGREYATSGDPRFLREREIVERYGGRVVFHSGDVVFSSTRLIESLARDASLDEHRLRTLCARHGIDAATAAATLEAFQGLRVLVAGDLIVEKYVLCDASEAADDAPVLALRRLGADEYLGGAAATALQLAALGARPTLLAATSPDAGPSGPLAQRLSDAGVEPLLIPARPTIVERSTFVADDAKLFKLTDGPVTPLDSAAERRAAGLIGERLAELRLLVWADHGFGALTPGLLAAVAPRAAARGITVAGYAPGRFGELALLRGSDLLIATERQLRSALHDMTSGVPAVTFALLERTAGRSAIIALRRRGLLGFERELPATAAVATPQRLRSEYVSSFVTHGADWTGGEEAILAVAGLTLAAGRPVALATYLAAAGEALAVARAGPTPVRTAELAAWLERRPELRAESRFFPDAATVADLARIAPPLPVMSAP